MKKNTTVRFWNREQVEITLQQAEENNFLINNLDEEFIKVTDRGVMVVNMMLHSNGNYICRLNKEYFETEN